AAARLPRLARAGDTPLWRPRKARGMATGTEPAADRHVSDHYALLGVRPDASPQEIESAYRRGALELGYQDGAWRELRDAYDVLRDPEERARYDSQRDGLGPPKGAPQKKTHNPLDRL